MRRQGRVAALILQRIPWPATLRGAPALICALAEGGDAPGADLLAGADRYDALTESGHPDGASMTPRRALAQMRHETRWGQLSAAGVELLARMLQSTPAVAAA